MWSNSSPDCHTSFFSCALDWSFFSETVFDTWFFIECWYSWSYMIFHEMVENKMDNVFSNHTCPMIDNSYEHRERYHNIDIGAAQNKNMKWCIKILPLPIPAFNIAPRGWFWFLYMIATNNSTKVNCDFLTLCLFRLIVANFGLFAMDQIPRRPFFFPRKGTRDYFLKNTAQHLKYCSRNTTPPGKVTRRADGNKTACPSRGRKQIPHPRQHFVARLRAWDDDPMDFESFGTYAKKMWCGS